MNIKAALIITIASMFLFIGCSEKIIHDKPAVSIVRTDFGKMPDGTAVDLYTLKNADGMVARITNYGGIVTELYTSDRNGNMDDVVPGYENLEKYLQTASCFGSLIRRYSGQIPKGKFSLDEVEHTLTKGNNENNPHSSNPGCSKVVWDARGVVTFEGPSLELTYLSHDGEEGFCGNLLCKAVYTLTNDNRLEITFRAITDKAAVVNLTHKICFNLAGIVSGSILNHELMIDADHYTPADTGLVPTGETEAVADGPLNFTVPAAIGARIDELEDGYNHNYVLNNSDGSYSKIASVYEPKTGRLMEVYSTEPGLRFYSGRFPCSTKPAKDALCNHFNGFCLRTQHLPDFPSTVLRPGQVYNHKTSYKFSAIPCRAKNSPGKNYK